MKCLVSLAIATFFQVLKPKGTMLTKYLLLPFPFILTLSIFSFLNCVLLVIDIEGLMVHPDCPLGRVYNHLEDVFQHIHLKTFSEIFD